VDVPLVSAVPRPVYAHCSYGGFSEKGMNVLVEFEADDSRPV